MTPLVSIIVPVYNGERFVERAIASALAQTYRNIELIVVDDGSTDRTAPKVSAFQDSRIQYVYQENRERGAARNNGIRNSAGKYITFLDADDRYLPEKVQRQVEFLLANPQFKVVYCHELWFRASRPDFLFRRQRIRASHDVLSDLMENTFVNINAMMVERAVFDKAGLFNETRVYPYPEDWELWLRIALAGFEFGCLHQDLVIVEVKDLMDLPFDWQWRSKEAAIQMLQRLFPGPREVGGVVYDAARTIQTLTLKLSVGYLLVGRKDDFFRTFLAVCPGPKVLVQLLARCLLVVPPGLIRMLWLLNRYRKSKPVMLRGLSA